MSTSQCLVTRLLHHIEALALSTNISECWLHTWRCLGQLFLAEPAESSIVLITCLASMVWLSIALCTKVFLASIASYSMVSHVLGSLSRDGVSFVIFLTFDNISRFHHHDVSTSTTYHVWILFNNLHLLILIDCILLFLVQVLV